MNKVFLCTEGSGKGTHSQVGAIAEAAEHYHLEFSSLDDAYPIQNKALSSQSGAAGHGILQTLGTLSGETTRLRLTEVATDQGIDIPALLLNPTQIVGSGRSASEGFLRRYASNSGMAFDCSLAEARLHALNEVIERNFLSSLYLGLIGKRDALPLTRVSFDDTWRGCVRSLNAALFIDKTSFVTFFSIARDNEPPHNHQMSLVGSGCSAMPDLVQQRALSELVQARTLYDDAHYKIDQATRDRLSSVGFDSLIDLPITDHKDHTVHDAGTTHSVLDQVRRILSHLNVGGYRAYERIVANYPNLGAVVQIYTRNGPLSSHPFRQSCSPE